MTAPPSARPPNPPITPAQPQGYADLHRHLDGSLRSATVAQFARDLGLEVPERLVFEPGMGLDAALSRFAFTCALLQTTAALTRVAAEMCEDAAAEGVTTLEIRFAPQLHVDGPPTAQQLAEIVDAVLDGVAGRAGLILCGLYGDPPALLDALVAIGATRAGVVGIDLAGSASPTHRHQLADYAAAYAHAARVGLGRTVHAGEGHPAAQIRAAVELLGAQRIGHATTLLDDPALVDLMRERGVVIEACPTSNWQTGLVPTVAAHPLPLWLARGLKCTVNTDNVLLCGVTIGEELDRALTMPGIDDAQRARLIAEGRAAAFPRA